MDLLFVFVLASVGAEREGRLTGLVASSSPLPYGFGVSGMGSNIRGCWLV